MAGVSGVPPRGQSAAHAAGLFNVVELLKQWADLPVRPDSFENFSRAASLGAAPGLAQALQAPRAQWAGGVSESEGRGGLAAILSFHLDQIKSKLGMQTAAMKLGYLVREEPQSNRAALRDFCSAMLGFKGETKPDMRVFKAAIKEHSERFDEAHQAVVHTAARNFHAATPEVQHVSFGQFAAQALPVFAQTLQQVAEGTVAVTQKAFAAMFAQNLMEAHPDFHAVLFGQQTPEVQQQILGSQNATARMLNEGWAESIHEQEEKDKKAQVKSNLAAGVERRVEGERHEKVVRGRRGVAQAEEVGKQTGRRVKPRE